MSGLTPKQQPKAIKAGFCQFCRKDMRAMPRGLSRKFCSEECKGKARYAPTKTIHTIKHKPDAFSGRLFDWFIREMIRAGTDQIFNGVGEAELGQLCDIARFCDAANGYEFESVRFQKCHIAGVKSDDVMGLLHPKNLVVASADLNIDHGTKHFNSAGVFIPRSEVVKNIPPNITRAQAIKRILNKIGEDVVLRVIKAKKIQPSQREKYIAYILNRCDDYTETQLLDMTNKALAEIDADLRERPVNNYRFRTSGYSEEYVVVHEAIRLGFVEFLPASDSLDWFDVEFMQCGFDLGQHVSESITTRLSTLRGEFIQLAFNAFHGDDNWQAPLAALSVELDILKAEYENEKAPVFTAYERLLQPQIPMIIPRATPVETFAFDPESCPF